MKNKLFLYVLPAAIFIFGCILHYTRGYYYTGITAAHALGADDAYISYRYGWNLTHFGTLSWNESEYRRTEGFTNPLWVYLSAGLALPGHKEWVYPLCVIISTLVTLLFLLALINRVYKENGRNIWAILGLLLLAATPAIWLHTTSGLESAVFGAALALLAYIVVFDNSSPKHKVVVISLALFIGFLRSDGFIYLGILLGAAWIAGSPNWKHLALGLLVSSSLLLLWRQIEFGAWLPNTVAAKINFDLLTRIRIGSVWLLFSMLTSGLLTLLLLGLASVPIISKRRGLACLWIILVWLSYYVFIGGDHFAERHLIGLFFLAAAVSASLWRISKPFIRVILILCVSGAILLSVSRDYGRFDYASPKNNDPWVMLGMEMQYDRPSYGVVVTIPAGKIPFFAGGDFIDALGLNDPSLSSYRRDQFVPGHSAGSDQAALELARLHQSGIYSLFSYLDSTIISGPEFIRLWVNNREPQATVQTTPTQQEWQSALDSDDLFLWSIIWQPVVKK